MGKIGRLIVAVLLPLAMSGCMSSGVIDMGHDKYAVSFNSLGGGANARAWAYHQAAGKCGEQERELFPITESFSEVRGSATSTVTFKCLDKADPQLKNFRNYTN